MEFQHLSCSAKWQLRPIVPEVQFLMNWKRFIDSTESDRMPQFRRSSLNVSYPILFGTYRYGYFICNNSYFFCHSPSLIKQIFDTVRYGSPNEDPQTRARLKRQSLDMILNGIVGL
jgi:hypothetical protein